MNSLKQIKVAQFLKNFKEIVEKGGFDFIHREKNLACLTELGLTIKDCEEIVLGLSVEDYCSGPKVDRDMPGEVWEFGKETGKCKLYIKLKIFKVDTEEFAKCISFHNAEFRLKFPHKK